MAKKSATGNKSQAIRDALQANPQASPKEISATVNEQGFNVTPAYVSIVKYNLSKSSGGAGRKVRVKKMAGRRAGVSTQGFAQMQSAVEFIQACGGLEQAKSVLAQVEAIRSVV